MKEGYDMVIVSRYAEGAKSYDDDIVTGFGNKLFTTSINLLHGAKYTDAMVIYRAYKKSLIHDLDLLKEESYSTEEKLFGTIVSWEPLLSVRAAKRKLKTAAIFPTKFSLRKQSTLPLNQTLIQINHGWHRIQQYSEIYDK